MLLLRHKKTGNVYAHNKVLWDSGDYEEITDKEPEPVATQPEPVKVVRRRRSAIKTTGEPNGEDTQSDIQHSSVHAE